jgi:hypothetical protein
MNVSVNGEVYTEYTGCKLEITSGAYKDVYRILSTAPGSRIEVEFGPKHETIADALRLRHAPIDDEQVQVMYEPAEPIKEITVTAGIVANL